MACNIPYIRTAPLSETEKSRLEEIHVDIFKQAKESKAFKEINNRLQAVKAKYAVIGLAAIDLFGGVARFSNDNVAHFAHLGGALTGFILVLIWNKRNRRRFY